MSEPTTSALTIEGLHVRRGAREILHGIDLTVAAGEVVAVLGPNGAGKSTLVNTVAGTLKATAGTVRSTGRVATLMQSPGLARRSARANVELALAWWGVPRGQRRARAHEALERMRAAELARRPAQQLSGGEQRRVHLARALAVAPDVLLLDEPFDGLDPQTHTALRDDTADALRTDGAAVLVVLHDRADAWAIADRIVVLIEGSVQAVGTPRQLITAPPTVEVARFLGYDGELTTPDGVVLTRAANVHLDDDGPITGTVGRVIVTEDAARVRIDTGHGSVWALDPTLRRRVGDPAGVSLRDAVTFEPRS